jgi:hypothetical protein
MAGRDETLNLPGSELSASTFNGITTFRALALALALGDKQSPKPWVAHLDFLIAALFIYAGVLNS